ncbi:hypothetical protein HNQ93_004310 [Hymenobacter luteus]|uniref:Uncharacterized protein n=2 Tax=Hymenobacter TaxID=89966 RepID=A0A7W9WEF5_9BACT|nr:MULTISPECIES: hypothetical protein [Hymenobacter]MBB4601521.1 hypothetical protein [Hymenobacter latericoloratus]MBB6061431.1 hypothetical protein [Hymenobacter luteus]
MEDIFEEKLQGLLDQHKLEEAIAVVEQQILQNPVADFKPVVGKNLLHITEALVQYLDHCFAAAENKIQVKSLYAEMNSFTINYDLWYVDVFAYDRNEGLEDTDWLADSDYQSAASQPITGLEDIQAVYQDYMDTAKWEDDAREVAAHECAALIVLRVQELFKAAKAVATARKLAWASVPVYVTAHDAYFNLLYQV